MKRILVAVDGSDPARHAMNYAAQLAKTIDAELHLAYAVPIMPLPVEVTAHGMAELMARHRSWGDTLVETLKKELPADVNATTHVRDGSPDEVINELANNLAADMVVV